MLLFGYKVAAKYYALFYQVCALSIFLHKVYITYSIRGCQNNVDTYISALYRCDGASDQECGVRLALGSRATLTINGYKSKAIGKRSDPAVRDNERIVV
jgi:hypothetical protein